MYDFKKIDSKWQQYWEESGYYKVSLDLSKKKQYNLVEFPYPSGIGMHIGHIKAYLGLEVLSRYQRLKGLNVLFPMGFDAFGLPAENYAMKVGRHPRDITDENIKIFTNQLKRVGFSFNYEQMIDTTDPKYYKWTQWIFLKLFEKGLAYRDRTYVNYCPSCKVVLSNEDSQGGECDRCGTEVIQKEKDVWFLKITAYAEKLLEGLDTVDFPSRVRLGQENWIGKSEGAYINFKIKETEDCLRIYTTRPDTIFGATFMVIAPEHPLIEKNKERIVNYEDLVQYKVNANKKTEFERIQVNKDKTGVKIEGLKAVNPVNDEEIAIYVADYVMMGYGTGAIMAVPAHDDRDFEFATKFNIPIVSVIEGGDISKAPYIGEGKMINSEFLNGITTKNEAIAKMIDYLTTKGIGEKGIQYKMKDWAFNRQRYWGEPIPIVYCEKCGMVPVPYEELPLKLPDLKEFQPGPDGESPLANVKTFVNCKCPKCGSDAKRETDTMPQWAGSSWYYLRYCDPFNDKEICSMDKQNYWMNVDVYNGGTEHISRHLIYSRFWHHFLYDIGAVNTKEPYQKRTTQGLILGSDNLKMSKSKGNTIDPLDVANEYGADVLRTYILFMGDYGEDSPWNEQGVKGVSRFLDRVYRLQDIINDKEGYSLSLESIIHKTIKKVSEDIENLKYNTAIAEMMKLINSYYDQGSISKKDYEVLLTLLFPFAPHVTEEINSLLKNGSLTNVTWPEYDAKKMVKNVITMSISINGKHRANVKVLIDSAEEEVLEKAKKEENIIRHLEGKEIIKEIVVPNKIINFIVK